MRATALDTALLATGAALWLAILVIMVCCGMHLIRRAKQSAAARALADADAARTAAAFAAAVGEPAPTAPTPRRRHARALLAEATAPPPPQPPPLAGLSLAQIDEAAPCMVSPRGTTCSICLEEVEVAAPQRMLPCKHAFHPDCIRLWLPRANRCPQCQTEVMPDERKAAMAMAAEAEAAFEEPPPSFRVRAAAAFVSLRSLAFSPTATSPVSDFEQEEDHQGHQQGQMQRRNTAAGPTN